MKTTGLFVGLLVLFLVIPGCLGISKYNQIMAQDEACTAAWANVENAMQRRFDLIPNLVDTVKAVAKHETELFTQLAKSRENYINAKTPEGKQSAFSQASLLSAKLLKVAENYPNLKSSDAFLGLQNQLEGAENRVAFERKKYNDMVMRFNSTIRQFPGNMIKGFAGVERRTPFEIAEDSGASQPVRVGGSGTFE